MQNIKDTLEYLIKKDSDQNNSNSEQTEGVQKMAQWYFIDDNATEIAYDPKMNASTEAAYEKFAKGGSDTFDLSHGNFQYKITFDKNTENKGAQVNVKTSKLRYITRRMVDFKHPKLPGKDFNEKEIKLKSLKDTIKDYPDEWTDIENLSYKTSKYNTVSIDLASDVAKEVESMIKKTIDDVEIHQIEQIQNIVSYHKYIKERELLQSKYSDKDITIEK